MHGVMTLLAGLELSRQRAVTLRQARLFSELWILRRDLEAWIDGMATEPEEEAESVEDADAGSAPGTEVRGPGGTQSVSSHEGEMT